MSKEIERRWLVPFGFDTGKVTQAHMIDQGYLSLTESNVVRARHSQECLMDSLLPLKDGTISQPWPAPIGYITVKFDITPEIRDEFEYVIPSEDAQAMIASCITSTSGCVVAKTRHIIPREGHPFEIDVFGGYNEGLVMVEVEFDSEEECKSFISPMWFGREVTKERKYSNAALAQRPFKEWE